MIRIILVQACPSYVINTLATPQWWMLTVIVNQWGGISIV